MMTPTEFLQHLKTLPHYQGQLVHIERLPPKRARYGRLAHGLSAPLVDALKAEKTTKLYIHQAHAITAVQKGYDVVIATGTASGKTLCYNAPVLDAIIADAETRALYLFPTKALAHDQLRNLSRLAQRLTPQPIIGAYDGDTPVAHRSELRLNANILFTNPDMLHMAMLPYHERWGHFFRALKFVVIDEAHVYRGVFGSHVAAVLRRLNRIAAYYGAHPQYIATSATIANPKEHLKRLSGRDMLVIKNDGAPRSGKIFALWNPPPIRGEPEHRRSSVGEATIIFTEMVQAGIRNITFVKARVLAELILKYARNLLKRHNPALVERVMAYRAGYLVSQRRAIEYALNSGQVIGVTATNALELGVDVGGLQAVISVGYPGTIASLWQQVGRAGRAGYGRNKNSLAVLVAQDNPLDQYFMKHPDALFAKPHENALIDPNNFYVLLPHLACAAHELPLMPEDETVFGEGFISAMIALENQGALVYQPESDNWLYMGRNYPSRQVNIRSVGRKPISLIEATTGRKLEVMDASLAVSRVHPGAIFIHNGESYKVKELDLAAGVARLALADVDYYTSAIETSRLAVVSALRQQTFRRSVAFWGEVTISRRVVGYRKIHHLTEKESRQYALEMPVNSYNTRALWWSMPAEWRIGVSRRGLDFSGGLRAVAHVVAGLLPLFAMCDPRDIGGYTVEKNERGEAQIFIFDMHPGGVGIAEQGFLNLQELWRAALSTVKTCPCEKGCPSCIYSPFGGADNEGLDKRAAVWMLETLLR